MSKLDKKLLDIYMTYKDHDNPPVPLDIIKEFLELEGISIDDSMDINAQNSSKKNSESNGGNEFG